ncbi:DNA primase, small subunit [Methanosalsum zhilinae DSM 4017]|uniref:DNA primase small subunit PriS n=1 Tax=Methanosalsum zhilinae (strain DSM 4017 / NBRC 107636 / OCM 62 / WeN5) TaxID=679901 RepID=F7XPG2_METZD|nr:DNA primase catalytic subunit PriS [Methanosalsum zhilinae]AEH60291.1 DNA primase, small subunit [Methanosalsum zhilinae DSM 4017]
MNLITKQYLKERFQNYYKNNSVNPPVDYPSREWGFILFDEMPQIVMRRHKSFGSAGEVNEYLEGMVPSHCYYSVAYYRYPAASTMKEKDWLGADLIFDLDADHLPGAPTSYSEMLEHVKTETFKLYDFLEDDFGFSEDDIQIVFSGGRGYHLHINDPCVHDLDSSQRREIVDYISSTGLSIDSMFSKKQVSGDAGQENAKISSFPGENSGGWEKRINNFIISYLQRIIKKDNAVDLLSSYNGIGKKRAKTLIDIINNEDEIDLLRNGKIGNLSKMPVGFIKQIAYAGINEMIANVDEPVTSDIKRLIRLPGSLHGGSGMKVTVLSSSELDTFDPLTDAVVFGNESVEINVKRPYSLNMKGKEFCVEEGIYNLPEYAAIHLICRGVAEYGS